jgi:hypothetical protein
MKCCRQQFEMATWAMRDQRGFFKSLFDISYLYFIYLFIKLGLIC